MDICNCDDCVFNLNEHFDLALELAKVWASTQHASRDRYEVLSVYKYYKEKLGLVSCEMSQEEDEENGREEEQGFQSS